MGFEQRANELLRGWGIAEPWAAVWIGDQPKIGSGDDRPLTSPIDGQPAGELRLAGADQVDEVIEIALEAHRAWRLVPAPHRGELVRRYGHALRKHQEKLAELVTIEAGKITSEARGEVQEMIDICDFAVGLSRQLYGRTMPSERPAHRLTEQWHPLGPVGVITAFNFPVAVWAWNSVLALVCGDSVIWKPSEKTPLTAGACQAILQSVIREMSDVPSAVSNLMIGTGPEVGQTLAASSSVPLVSATGSVAMGRQVAETVAKRLGRSLLELGGNNAAIIAPSADLDLAIRAIVFAAVGTCGQRCTTLRRLIVHETLAEGLIQQLQRIWPRLSIGNPFDRHTLIGPLIDAQAFDTMQAALDSARRQGGTVQGGRRVTENVPQGGFYVQPALVEIDATAPIVQQETSAPILYISRYRDWDEAIHFHNHVPQGLASSIFTRDVQEAEQFCSAAGSDCGIVNVNIGPSGAEIGGAFGGEKDTGGGRESGSDAWKAYMRRTTNTINYANQLPLAQGIQFDVPTE